VQSTATALAGHACVLHACDTDNDGHAAPPLDAGVITVRFCDCTPPSHDAEQVLHADHSLTAQFTAQACVLHD